MNIAQRFTLLVKTSVTSIFESVEDPERSLNQLILDMDEELEAAKRATAQAMANEERLRARLTLQEKDAREWEEAARRSLKKGAEAKAREAMRRAEEAERQAQRLRDRLAAQEKDTAEIRESIRLMNERLRGARERLQILQAQIRQTQARRSMNKVMRSVESANLYGEFDRVGERVEQAAAEEAAYLRLDDEISGEDVKRRFEKEAVDDAVDERLARMRAELLGDTGADEAA